jgi:hypothetical protein
MKVALVLSGLPRKVKDGYDRTWKNIIENYDTDVYLHTWKDEDWEDVYKIYTTSKSFILQEPFKFTKYKEGIKLPHTDKSRPIPQYDVMSCFRQLPMFYSWQIAYKPLYDSMIDYDVVIRSRYDLGINNSIKLNDLNMDFINHATGSGKFFDDNLCITNKKNSDKIFNSIFDDLIDFAKKEGILNSAESTWTSMLRNYNVIDLVKKNHNLDFKLLRENKVWWGDADGNIIE